MRSYLKDGYAKKNRSREVSSDGTEFADSSEAIDGRGVRVKMFDHVLKGSRHSAKTTAEIRE